MKGTQLLKNTLAIGKYFSTEYSGEYAEKYAIGRILTVPMTQRYNVQRQDMTYNAQPFDRPFTTITMDQTASIALEWESIEKALDMERGEERVSELYIKPAVAYIRQAIESDLAQFAHTYTSMVVGALATNPTTYDATSAAALQYLTQMGCPIDDENLGLFVSPAVNRTVKTGAIALFNDQRALGKQFRTGFVEHADGFDWYRSNSLYTATAGTRTSTVTTNAANQSGSSLVCVCTTGDTFFAGEKFSIAAVNEVNLMSRATTMATTAAGTKTFTITQDATGAGSAVTLSIFPPIYGPGSHYQNVDALPGASATFTMWPGTTAPNGKSGKIALALYPGAFFLVSKKLEEPKGSVEFCEQFQDPDTGIPIRIIRQWDNRLSTMTTRMDSLWGRGVGLAEQCSVAIPCA